MPHRLVPRIADAELETEPLDPALIVSGTPEVTGKAVRESADGSHSETLRKAYAVSR